MMLRTKFYLGILPLLLLLVGVGIAGVFVCRDMAHSSEEKINRSYGVMMAAHEMRTAASSLTNAMHMAINGRTLEARPVFEEQRGRFKRALMEQSFAAAGTGRSRAMEQVADAFDRLEQVGMVCLDDSQVVTRARYEEIEMVSFATMRSLDDLLTTDYYVMREEAARVAGIARVAINVLIAVIVAGVLLSLFLAWRLAQSLLGPVGALTASARAFGEGDLDHDVPVQSRDELGVLAQAFNTMAAKLRTYREAMTERVQRAQRTMEATLTSAPDPLFVVFRDGSPQIRNPAAEKLAAMPEFSPGFPEELECHVREVMQTGQHFLPTDYDHVIAVHLDHDERFYLPRILAVGDSLAGPGGAAVILQDVTKFRLLDHAKTNLVGTVSHELKTPLTSLRMAVYLLLEQNVGSLTAAQRDLLETARDDADRLLRILNDILDLARIEGGAAAMSRREVDVRALLEDMAREIRPLANDAGQRVDVQVAPEISKVMVDPERIRHVFINFLGNASKYSPENGVITVYAEPAGADGAIRFGVRDQGVGIPEADVSRVFERFFRVSGQGKKGAGLGLSIAREIVLAHGGAIACSSKPGQGSDFYFVLPGETKAADNA